MKYKLNHWFLSLGVTVFCGCSDSVRYPSFSTLYTDYQAQQDVKKEKFEDALAKYYSLLEFEGRRPGTHSNIGVILNSMQKPEDALKSLLHAQKLAEDSGDPELIFKVRYNLGVYFGAQKNVLSALENYQVALDLVPDSKEIKTNIELLIQQNSKKSGKGDKDKDNPQNDGKGEGQQDKKPGDDQKDKDDKNGEDKKDDIKKEGSPKYQPRPFKGDQLSEGDVKKILGELKNQEQKIRANFDKKEKGKTNSNEKNW